MQSCPWRVLALNLQMKVLGSWAVLVGVVYFACFTAAARALWRARVARRVFCRAFLRDVSHDPRSHHWVDQCHAASLQSAREGTPRAQSMRASLHGIHPMRAIGFSSSNVISMRKQHAQQARSYFRVAAFASHPPTIQRRSDKWRAPAVARGAHVPAAQAQPHSRQRSSVSRPQPRVL